MKFFIDTADVNEIRRAREMGLLDGVTTNPSLVARTGRPMREVLQEICSLTDGPVSGEVLALDTEGMIREGGELAGIAENMVIKIPMTTDGMRAVRHLEGKGIRTNVTLVFSPLQAVLAAKAGASFISPFIGRLDDIHLDGMELIEDIRTIYDNYDFQTEILAASIRSVNHVIEAGRIGADVITAPPAVIKAMATHPLTDKGLDQFLKDWAKTGQKIV